jgi:hypothetical protein
VSDSTACVQFRSGGVAAVDASLRLTGHSHIQCCTYPDRPAILAVDDGHVSVSVTVPDSGQVTADDLATARRLADAITRYIADLEQRCPPLGSDAESTAA